MADALNTEYGTLLGEIDEREAFTAAEAATRQREREQDRVERTKAAVPTAAEPPAATSTGVSPGLSATDEAAAYDVLVPLTEGMTMAQWFKPARDRVGAMTEAQRPLADFIRFREVNSAALKRLQDELSGWAKLLNDAIARGSAGAPR
jgi:hypothetical protein